MWFCFWPTSTKVNHHQYITETLHKILYYKRWITQYVQIFGVDKINMVNKDTENDNMLEKIMKVENKNGLKKLRSAEVVDNLKDR